MPFCTNCGFQVDATARFCPNCGQQLAVMAANTAPAVVKPVYVEDTRRDYRVVLVARGTCSRAIAIDMISDLLGYTDLDAARIVDNVPMEVALGLTAVQAQVQLPAAVGQLLVNILPLRFRLWGRRIFHEERKCACIVIGKAQ